MILGDPVPMQFLPIADETWEVITDKLAKAYDLPNFPGECDGYGSWGLIARDDVVAGILWTNHDDGCGILPIRGYDIVSYTATALTIRLAKDVGYNASDAFRQLAGEADGIFHGDLAVLLGRMIAAGE